MVGDERQCPICMDAMEPEPTPTQPEADGIPATVRQSAPNVQLVSACVVLLCRCSWTRMVMLRLSCTEAAVLAAIIEAAWCYSKDMHAETNASFSWARDAPPVQGQAMPSSFVQAFRSPSCWLMCRSFPTSLRPHLSHDLLAHMVSAENKMPKLSARVWKSSDVVELQRVKPRSCFGRVERSWH